ncbi:hypothetical protein MAR_031696 [Mya arenaria]|uniref:Uncharacterized protein n=1 Tax=Mya arenaria TaxID=6604 RepID=A0ABY7F670_MYAAR|nr:hypothetical protein MAR_031696 [Mya arenaria]
MGPRGKQNELSAEEIEAIAKCVAKKWTLNWTYGWKTSGCIMSKKTREKMYFSIVNAAKPFKDNEDTPDVSPYDIFTKKDISVCHRVGSKAHGRNEAMKLRQILVRFISRQSIQSIFRCKKNLKNIMQFKNIIITDDVAVLRLPMKAIIKDTPRVNTVSSPDDLHKTSVDVVLKALGLEYLGQEEEGDVGSDDVVSDKDDFDKVDVSDFKFQAVHIIGGLKKSGGIERDCIDFKAEGYSICLLGDLNARTGQLSDFIVTQKTIITGTDSLNFIKTLDVHIVNGRLGSDAFIGKNHIVIDYLVLSPCFFPKIDKFDILPFNPLLSDVHNPVSFDFICNSQVHVGHSCNVKAVNNRAPIYMWSNDKLPDFLASIDHDELYRICTEIDNACDDINTCTNKFVNDITKSIGVILTDAACNCNLIRNKVRSGNKKKHESKHWFDNDC